MKIRLFQITFLLYITTKVFAQEGIVVAACDKYMNYLLPSIAHLRENLKCTLPIEVWHSGNEISAISMQRLANLGNITFRDIAKELNVHPTKYQGWHIKPWIIYLSSFDEVILMDADAYFYEDPSILFFQPGYIQTGAFFFRDRGIWHFPNKFPDENLTKSHSLEAYIKRRDYIRSLIPAHSTSLPSDWEFFWKEELPTAETPFLANYQESGCLAIDKKRHLNGLEKIIQLNEAHDITYQYVYGDKETYWMGFEIAKEPYYVNTMRACELRGSRDDLSIYMVHFLDAYGLFFSQKHPVFVEDSAYFRDHYHNRDYFHKAVSQEERDKIHAAYRMRLKYQ